MGRPKGSKNAVKALNLKVPQQIKMVRKLQSNRKYGLLPFPYPLTMFDCCDYYSCEILPGDGSADKYLKIAVKRISTEHALQNAGLSVYSDQELLLKFVKENPERKDDLARYLSDPRQNTIKRSLKDNKEYDFSGYTKRELTELIRDDDGRLENASYINAARKVLHKIIEDEKNG